MRRFVIFLLALLSIIPLVSLAAAPTEGLVAHYTFDDGTATDASGNGNNGTVNGATTVAGKVEGAIQFDGSSGKITIPPNSSLNLSNKTISFWVKPRILKYYNVLFEDNNNKYAGINVSGQIRVNWENSNGYERATNINANITTGLWQYITIVYDANGQDLKISIYKDGSFVASATATDGLSAATLTTLAARNSGSNVLDGEIDEMMIFNRALSTGEVTELFSISSAINKIAPPSSEASQPEVVSEPEVPETPPVTASPSNNGSIIRVRGGQSTSFSTINDAVSTSQSGDEIRVGDGVYRESVIMKSNGVRLVATGNNTIIDGADPLIGWKKCSSQSDCGNNPNWQSMYVTSLPAGMSALGTSLYENDTFLWWAQDPNPTEPLLFDEIDTFRRIPPSQMTRTSITDPSYLTASDPSYYQEAYAIVWRIPNVVSFVKIRSYNPSTHTITIDDVGGDLYSDRDEMYAIINNIEAIDRPGEYAVDEANTKVYVLPRVGVSNISMSQRRFGVDINGKSDVTIEGFKFRHFNSGVKQWNDGVAIRNGGSMSPVSNIIIRGNEISYLRSMVGQGAITIYNADGIIVENNNIHDNQKNGGMLFSGSNITVVNNRLDNNTGTAIRFYDVKNGSIIHNTVSGSLGTHANGLTIYKSSGDGSENILVAENTVTRTARPVTIQESKDVYIVNNILDGGNINTYIIADWGRMSGTVLIAENVVIGSTNHSAILVGNQINNPTYIIKNNILDGMLSSIPGTYNNNIYVGTNWQQRGPNWPKGAGDIFESDINKIFVSVLSKDYRLRSGSLALDAGADLSVLPVPSNVLEYLRKDFSSSARPQGGGWDIGAYEYYSGQPYAPIEQAPPELPVETPKQIVNPSPEPIYNETNPTPVPQPIIQTPQTPSNPIVNFFQPRRTTTSNPYIKQPTRGNPLPEEVPALPVGDDSPFVFSERKSFWQMVKEFVLNFFSTFRLRLFNIL